MRLSSPCRNRAAALLTAGFYAWSMVAAAQTSTPPAGSSLPWTSSPASAQAQPQQANPAAPGQAASAKTFSQEELDQLCAPIALHPDSLLASLLMASTYPLEVVMADRWIKQNASLKGKALEDALQKQTWDASVKSLTAFPQVLAMMSEKLDWTQKLGDAFLAQQAEVMATIQNLRGKAVAQGSLSDSKEQKVVTQKTETTTIIKIEPTNPEVVYVPTYNPTVVYGSWWYPSYPPYYYYPPGYVAGGALLGFTAGVIVGGALWGNVNWGGNDINIDVDRYNNFNRTNISNKNWQHNAEHRGAVPYRDQRTAQQYNRGANSPGAQARESYRGRDTQQAGARAGDASRGGGSLDRAGGGQGSFDRAGGGQGSFDRGGASQTSFDRGGGSRDYSGTRNSSAFQGGSRAQTSSYSNRGASSMSSMGGSRGGGGAARGGGGGRGGGRR
jgi:hypothetical protein